MIVPKDFYEALRSEGVDFYTGVPDSLLQDFCAYIDEHVGDDEHIITANEGSAIALATGYHLATGRVPLVYMQNSGLGNAVNPLMSLADREVYGIPMLLVVGWRGEPGVSDEPQHKKMGAVTIEMLDTLGIPCGILESTSDVSRMIGDAMAYLREESAPYAIVVRKGSFGSYSQKDAGGSEYKMTREEAVERVTASIGPDAIVVSTTGKLSRELFEIREKRSEGHAQDFLTVGSMGHASQIALGIALARPSRQVYCFDGDGAALMHMGGLAVIGQCAPRNLRHVVFNNGIHESVGGQGTAGFSTDLPAVATACGYAVALRAIDANGLQDTLERMRGVEGPIFLEIRIKGGSRDNLGRPTRSPKENKIDFKLFLRR